MWQRCSIGALAVLLPGCILSTQQCGPDFVEEADGRCVLAEPAPPYYSDATPDRAAVDAGPVDAWIQDARFAPDFEPEPAPDPEPDPSMDPWAGRTHALIVDRTSRDEARSTPTSPGYDLDAILLFEEDGELAGFGGPWESAQINDPFGRNLSRDPGAALGEPDSRGFDEPRAYVSLGADGGYVHLRLELFTPLRSGMTVRLFDMDADRANERAEVFLCFDGGLDLNQCRTAGIAQGAVLLPLGD